MDSSTAISFSEYNHEKTLVKIISKYLNVAPNKSRAAVLTYGRDPEIVTNFEGYQTVADFERLVDNAISKGGSTRIDKALDEAVNIAKTTRPGYPKITVLLTASRQSSDANDLRNAAQRLKDLGMKTYVIAIGQQPNKAELKPLVDRPDDMFSTDAFNTLQSVARPTARNMVRRLGKNYWFLYLRNRSHLQNYLTTQVTISTAISLRRKWQRVALNVIYRCEIVTIKLPPFLPHPDRESALWYFPYTYKARSSQLRLYLDAIQYSMI